MGPPQSCQPLRERLLYALLEAHQDHQVVKERSPGVSADFETSHFGLGAELGLTPDSLGLRHVGHQAPLDLALGRALLRPCHLALLMRMLHWAELRALLQPWEIASISASLSVCSFILSDKEIK